MDIYLLLMYFFIVDNMRQELNIDEIMDLELMGVIRTINEYTQENFIRNYTDLLKECEYPKDIKKMTAISYRLKEWYAFHYKEITDNQFIYNKHEHLKSIEIIDRLLEILETTTH